MAVQAWTNMSVLLGGYEVACHAKNVDAPTVAVNPLDTTALCTTGWTSVIAGLTSISWGSEIMQDFADAELDQTLGISGSGFAASQPMSICPTGNDDGSLAYSFRANTFEYTPIMAQVGDLAMGRIGGAASKGPCIRGTIMHSTDNARSSTGTGTARQLGAVTSTQSMYAALHVLSASGTSPTLDVVIQSDDNSGMSSATSRITFAQASAGRTSQWAKVDGAVTDDYWRVSYTIGGSTPSFTFAVVLGIAATV